MINATPDTTAARVEKRLAELTAQRAARENLNEVLRSMPQHEAHAYDAETAEIDALIVRIGKVAAACSSLQSSLDADVEWLPHLKAWREALSAELLAMPPRIRNERELEQKVDLEWSIRLIDHGSSAMALPVVTLQPTRVGRLMRQAGFEVQGEGLRGPRGWRGSLPEVEARIKANTVERDKAHAKLDALLLSDSERAERDAAVAAHRAALNAMRVQQNPDGNGLIAFTPDDELLLPEDMTPEQRAAFEWFTPSACPPR